MFAKAQGTISEKRTQVVEQHARYVPRISSLHRNLVSEYSSTSGPTFSSIRHLHVRTSCAGFVFVHQRCAGYSWEKEREESRELTRQDRRVPHLVLTSHYLPSVSKRHASRLALQSSSSHRFGTPNCNVVTVRRALDSKKLRDDRNGALLERTSHSGCPQSSFKDKKGCPGSMS